MYLNQLQDQAEKIFITFYNWYMCYVLYYYVNVIHNNYKNEYWPMYQEYTRSMDSATSNFALFSDYVLTQIKGVDVISTDFENAFDKYEIAHRLLWLEGTNRTIYRSHRGHLKDLETLFYNTLWHRWLSEGL